MPALRFEDCPRCGERTIRRGRTVLNIHGTPLTHALTCSALTAPGVESAGQEEEDTA